MKFAYKLCFLFSLTHSSDLPHRQKRHLTTKEHIENKVDSIMKELEYYDSGSFDPATDTEDFCLSPIIDTPNDPVVKA